MIYKRIKEVANLLNGYAFKSKNYVESGIRVIRIANVQDGFISDEKPCFYPDCSGDEIGKYMLQEGDLLISLTGNVGRVGLLTKEFLPAALNQRVSCIRIKPDAKLELTFLYYFLLRKQFVRDCIKASKGVAQLNLSTKWLENYLIPVPDLEAQKRIVSRIEESLSQLDSAVETLKKTKQQLEVYRQAVLKEAFSFESAEQIVEVSQITDSIRIGPFGTMLHKSDYVNDGIPVINPQHIKNGVIVPSSKNSISVEKAKELSNYQLKTNDIIMGRRGEMGRSAPVTDIENGWLCGTGSIFFRLKPDFDAPLYSKILSSPSIVHYLEENATGTTMKNLNEDIVSHIPVPYIDKSKQNQIMQRLEERLSVCKSIETTINQSLQQAEALRQSILKQVFEGN